MSLEKEIAKLIANEVSWFNGWKASEEMFNKSCRKASRSVIKRLTKRAPDARKSALKKVSSNKKGSAKPARG